MSHVTLGGLMHCTLVGTAALFSPTTADTANHTASIFRKLGEQCEALPGCWHFTDDLLTECDRLDPTKVGCKGWEVTSENTHKLFYQKCVTILGPNGNGPITNSSGCLHNDPCTAYVGCPINPKKTSNPDTSTTSPTKTSPPSSTENNAGWIVLGVGGGLFSVWVGFNILKSCSNGGCSERTEEVRRRRPSMMYPGYGESPAPTQYYGWWHYRNRRNPYSSNPTGWNETRLGIVMNKGWAFVTCADNPPPNPAANTATNPTANTATNPTDISIGEKV